MEISKSSIPDIVEVYGLKPNGEPIRPPNLKDSDGDGIEDQIELGYMNINQIVYTPQGYLEYLTYTSDPAKADTDGDGYSDAYDAFPLTSSLIVDGEASEALMEELNEYLNHIMPPLVDENGKPITKSKAVKVHISERGTDGKSVYSETVGFNDAD